MTDAKIILDSTTANGDRLTTMEVTLHRFVLAELNTHRVFSRNSASSRAIPVDKQLAMLHDEPAWPVEWPGEKSGMQGGELLQGDDLADAWNVWDEAFEQAYSLVNDYVVRTRAEGKARLHKSLLNRLLEPFMKHKVILSATEWKNFFDQRCSPLAQPEIRVAAEAMRKAYNESTPKLLKSGEWHTPYIQDDEYESLDLEERIKVSAARCARVSYLTHDGVRGIEKDLELYSRLTTAEPPHWSPLEHVASPGQARRRTTGNFDGWVQLRHATTKPYVDDDSLMNQIVNGILAENDFFVVIDGEAHSITDLEELMCL